MQWTSEATSTSRRVLVPLPTITIFNIRSAARRPTCVEPARPWLSEGVKSLQRGRKISAWRGHEDSGGEGQLGREPGRPGGDQFFPWEDLCKLLFVWILLSLSLVKVIVKVKFGLAPLVLYSMQQHVTRAWVPKHVMRVENKFREKRGVLVVV